MDSWGSEQSEEADVENAYRIYLACGITDEGSPEGRRDLLSSGRGEGFTSNGRYESVFRGPTMSFTLWEHMKWDMDVENEMIGLDCLRSRFCYSHSLTLSPPFSFSSSGSSDDPDPDRIESGLANREAGGGGGGGGRGKGHAFRGRGNSK